VPSQGIPSDTSCSVPSHKNPSAVPNVVPGSMNAPGASPSSAPSSVPTNAPGASPRATPSPSPIGDPRSPHGPSQVPSGQPLSSQTGLRLYASSSTPSGNLPSRAPIPSPGFPQLDVTRRHSFLFGGTLSPSFVQMSAPLPSRAPFTVPPLPAPSSALPPGPASTNAPFTAPPLVRHHFTPSHRSLLVAFNVHNCLHH
jgi:hypothetical protein